MACFLKEVMHDKKGSRVWWTVPQRDADETRQSWASMTTPVDIHTRSWVQDRVVTWGHPFHVVMADSLFVMGVHPNSVARNP